MKSEEPSEGMIRLKVDQCLHGYSAGHRMLASSRRLSTTGERLISVLSDLSGPMPSPEFETYLSVYPVVSDEVVAFARTWYAYEMPRPGCAWTHTLLIPFQNIAELKSLKPLLGCFVRPLPEREHAKYARTLEITPDDADPVARSLIERHLAEAVLRYWYGAIEKAPLVIPSTSSGSMESLLLALWDQQVPRFRRTISISTGSITDRRIGEKSFDIQAVPRTQVREVLRYARAKNVEQYLEETIATETVGFSLLVDDVQKGPIQGLRDFLIATSNDETSLPDLARYAAIFELIESPPLSINRLSCLLNELRGQFPSPSDASSLKAFLLGAHNHREGYFNVGSEAEVLRAIISAEDTSFLDLAGLKIVERCEALATENEQDAVELLSTILASRSRRQENVDGAIRIVRSLSAATLLGFVSQEPRALSFVVSARPDLASLRALWVRFPPRKVEIVVTAAGAKVVDRSLMSSLLDAISEDRDAELIDALIEHASEANFRVLLEVAAENPLTRDSVFGQGLRYRHADLTRWLADQGELPLSIMDAMVRQLSVSALPPNFPFGVWRDSIANVEHRHERAVRICAFTLALGFKWERPEAKDFIRICFEPVFERARKDGLDYSSWRLLEPFVPSLWPFDSWDKCERLSQGLVKLVVARGWEAPIILSVATTRDTQRQVLISMGRLRYFELLNKLERDVDGAGAEVDAPWLRELIRESRNR